MRVRRVLLSAVVVLLLGLAGGGEGRVGAQGGSEWRVGAVTLVTPGPVEAYEPLQFEVEVCLDSPAGAGAAGWLEMFADRVPSVGDSGFYANQLLFLDDAMCATVQMFHPRGLPPGQHTIYAFMDAMDGAAEGNEEDNVGATVVDVTVDRDAPQPFPADGEAAIGGETWWSLGGAVQPRPKGMVRLYRACSDVGAGLSDPAYSFEGLRGGDYWVLAESYTTDCRMNGGAPACCVTRWSGAVPLTVSAGEVETAVVILYQGQACAGYAGYAPRPHNPEPVVEVNEAPDGVWQSGVGDPQFVWSQPSGSQTCVYWGSDADGYAAGTSGGGYDPPALAGGSYYLRASTAGPTASFSGWETVYRLKYDGDDPFFSVISETHGLAAGACQANYPQPTFSWQAGDETSGVEAVVASSRVGEALLGPSAIHTVPYTRSVSDTVTITVRDRAGNEAAWAFPFCYDGSAVSALLSPGAASSLVVTSTEGTTTTVDAGADAVGETAMLVYTPLPAPSHPFDGGLAFGGRAFDLAVHRDGVVVPDFPFETPLTVTISYSEADVAGVELEGALTLLHWNEETEAWEDAACGPYERDLEANWLALEVCGLGEFALLGPARVWTVHLPLAVRNYPPLIGDAPDGCPGMAVELGRTYREDFDHANDNDRFAFAAEAGQSYVIETGDLEARADTILTLYAPDCVTPLAQNDDVSYPTDVASRVVWECPFGGRYHVMVRSYDWRVYGEGTGYSLRITPAVEPGEAPLEASGGSSAKPPVLPTPRGRRPAGQPSLLGQKPPPPPTPTPGPLKPSPLPTPSGPGPGHAGRSGGPVPTPAGVILLPQTGGSIGQLGRGAALVWAAMTLAAFLAWVAWAVCRRAAR